MLMKIPVSWVDTSNLNLWHMIYTTREFKPRTNGGKQVEKQGKISVMGKQLSLDSIRILDGVGRDDINKHSRLRQ